MPEAASVWRILKGGGVKYVKFVIVDIFGYPRVDIMNIDEAKYAFVDGVSFDASSIPAYSTVNRSDMVAHIDLNAIYIESWNGGKTALVFTSVYDGGKPSVLDPRNFAKATIDKIRARGLDVLVGVELEFFLTQGSPPRPVDHYRYFDHQLGPGAAAIEEIMEQMVASGVGHTKIHHEVAPGQFEVNIPADDLLRTADNILVFKIMARDIARRHGFTITFMPKPFWGVNGSGAHVHLSFWRDGRNLFASRGEPSGELRHAVGGLLQYALQNSVWVAPTVNSYKRLVPHHEAPTRVVWGVGNRSAMIRIPHYGGKINRLEYRHPDPSMNPYTALTTIILTALEGLEKKTEPPPPTTEIAYELKEVAETPPNLGEAIRLAKYGGVEIELKETYLRLKEAEWENYLTEAGSWEKTWNKITEWEYVRYLETA
ncbi:MAG: glutamine synthetase family protein [Pyrobaculum sp.]